VTRFSYEAPITESVMEARMQPRTDATQHCLHFALTAAPRARVMMYRDHDGNTVHHFDIPGRHSRLTLTAEALVECSAPPPLPPRLPPAAWQAVDALAESGDCWEYLAPSTFARPTLLLRALARDADLHRRDDPLTLLTRLMAHMHERFDYRPQTTRVDSPIDEALEARCGVCQDFAHIFIALARDLRIPARYVSGYLHHDASYHDRSDSDATHAWVEVFLPELGWVGLDPTNNLFAGERHIRVAVGRDYADVPPTRGVFKGVSAVRSDLAVAVQVGPVSPSPADVVPFTPWLSRDAAAPLAASAEEQQQQQ
jgi:transglutaminase-like putative cysteine protease